MLEDVPLKQILNLMDCMLNHCVLMLDIITTIPQNTAFNSNALILKTKIFPAKFYSILECTGNVEYFREKHEPHSLSIFEIILSEKR